MFVTNYGSFDGTSWENMFQIILKRKHMSVGYQRVVASPGDFGIEGFTRDGQAFQCYCPNFNEEAKKLYSRQRDKITEDIDKLKTNQKELLTILGGVVIKSWTLITPIMSHHDLLAHCNKKREDVKAWKLPFIDNENFEVLVHESDDYALEIGEYFNQTEKKFSLLPATEDTSDSRLVQWKDTEIDLVKNALTKNEVRIRSTNKNGNVEHQVNVLTDDTARNYLNGESILRVWRASQPENHQRFIELVASVESELREMCILTEVQPNQFVDYIKVYIENKIKTAFAYLDESTVVRLKNYCISFWLMRCPLYFEETANGKENN